MIYILLVAAINCRGIRNRELMTTIVVDNYHNTGRDGATAALFGRILQMSQCL